MGIPDRCGCLEDSSVWPAEGIWKCIRSPAWLWLQDSAAETVHLRVCVNGRVVDKLESRNGTQSTTVTEPVQSLKYQTSCPADLSHGIVNADFAIFFREVLEFGSFHSRVFCFTISRHHTSFFYWLVLRVPSSQNI